MPEAANAQSRPGHGGRRIHRILHRLVAEFALDLNGLVVYTEAASGAYLYTPVLAALAGAEVIAVTRDSRFATAADVIASTRAAAREFGVAGRIDIVTEKTPGQIARADILTNTGFVRPINEEMVARLKPTAVVPLMWETWEYREGEVALEACRGRGIPVLGTNESLPPLNMDPYAGMLALNVLFRLGLEGYKNRVLLIGGEQLGRRIQRSFAEWGIVTAWFADDEPGAMALATLGEFWREHGAEFDAIIFAELRVTGPLLARDGLLTGSAVAALNPDVRIGVIAGNIDADELADSGVAYLPEVLPPPGYMGCQLYDMGPQPILELYAGGLKVGQVMARVRLAGGSIADAVAAALAGSPAMDFPGDLAFHDE